MKEVPFSIPLSGVVRMNGDTVVVIVNRAETTISLSPGLTSGEAMRLGLGITTYDVILETAREVVNRKGINRFSAPELYHIALEKYPGLKRNSFMSRVVASTPDHSSYRHYKSKRDYFSHIGPGLYKLNKEYMTPEPSDEQRVGRNINIMGNTA